MPTELNPAQLRLKRISNNISDVLVKEGVAIDEAKVIFDYLLDYQTEWAGRLKCKSLPK